MKYKLKTHNPRGLITMMLMLPGFVLLVIGSIACIILCSPGILIGLLIGGFETEAEAEAEAEDE